MRGFIEGEKPGATPLGLAIFSMTITIFFFASMEGYKRSIVCRQFCSLGRNAFLKGLSWLLSCYYTKVWNFFRRYPRLMNNERSWAQECTAELLHFSHASSFSSWSHRYPWQKITLRTLEYYTIKCNENLSLCCIVQLNLPFKFCYSKNSRKYSSSSIHELPVTLKDESSMKFHLFSSGLVFIE